MVQIDAPENPVKTVDQLKAGSSSVDSGAITEDAIAPEGNITAGDPPVEPGFAGGEEFAAGGLPPAPIGWQSDRTRRTRQIALVATLAASVLLVAVLAFGWFVSRYKADSATKIAAIADDAETGPVNSADASPSETSPEIGDTAEPDTSDRSPNDNDVNSEMLSDPEQTDAPEQTSEIETSDPKPRQPIIPVDLMPRSPLDSAVASDPRSGTATDPTAIPGLDPMRAGDEVDPDASKLMELPPGLAQYTQFLLQESPTEKATLKAPPTMDEVQLEDATDEDMEDLADVEPRTLNLKSDLAIKLALRSEGYPLTDLMLRISQITGVPIQIDWVSFDLVGTDVGMLVKPPKTLMSAREILDFVAAEANAEIRERATLLELTPTQEQFGNAYSRLAGLSDFGDGAESAGELLAAFVQPDPPPLAVDADGNPIEVEADVTDPVAKQRAEQQLVSLSTEVLRRIRGIDGHVPDAILHRWTQTSSSDIAEWPKVMAGETGPAVDTPIALAGFLSRVARGNKTSCLVNWFDANRRRATPTRLLLPDTAAGMEKMLSKALSPVGLSIRQVDGEHWWVGSDSTYDRLPVIVASVPLGANRATFVHQINHVMTGATRDQFRLEIDEESDRALMMLPRFVVRQLGKVTQRLASQ